MQIHEWLLHKPTIQPPHSRDLLNPDDGNYNLQEEVFDIGLDNEDIALRAYRHHRHDDPTYNMSPELDIGWGQGVWTARENVQRPGASASWNSHSRHDMDLNRIVSDFSLPYVPPSSPGGIPLYIPSTISAWNSIFHDAQMECTIVC